MWWAGILAVIVITKTTQKLPITSRACRKQAQKFLETKMVDVMHAPLLYLFCGKESKYMLVPLQKSFLLRLSSKD